MSVRPAAPDDVARCAELLAAAQREASRARGGALLAALAGGPATVDEWAAQGPSRRLLVGVFEEAVVGLASGHLREPAGGHRVGRMDCCYVEPEARQMGVGGALAAELVSWFAAEGCTGVDALALPGDRDSKQLYENAGFKARLLVLHRPLR